MQAPRSAPWAAAMLAGLLGACSDEAAEPSCAGVTCSGHGTCVESTGGVRCQCAGTHRPVGLTCVAWSADGDADADADCQLPETLEPDCADPILELDPLQTVDSIAIAVGRRAFVTTTAGGRLFLRTFDDGDPGADRDISADGGNWIASPCLAADADELRIGGRDMVTRDFWAVAIGGDTPDWEMLWEASGDRCGAAMDTARHTHFLFTADGGIRYAHDVDGWGVVGDVFAEACGLRPTPLAFLPAAAETPQDLAGACATDQDELHLLWRTLPDGAWSNEPVLSDVVGGYDLGLSRHPRFGPLAHLAFWSEGGLHYVVRSHGDAGDRCNEERFVPGTESVGNQSDATAVIAVALGGQAFVAYAADDAVQISAAGGTPFFYEEGTAVDMALSLTSLDIVWIDDGQHAHYRRCALP